MVLKWEENGTNWSNVFKNRGQKKMAKKLTPSSDALEVRKGRPSSSLFQRVYHHGKVLADQGIDDLEEMAYTLVRKENTDNRLKFDIIKWFVDRYAPVSKVMPIRGKAFEAIKKLDKGNYFDVTNEIALGTLKGHLSSDEAKGLLEMVKTTMEIDETMDLEARITELQKTNQHSVR